MLVAAVCGRILCAEYCITEDYALSMELKAAGFKGAYMVRFSGQLSASGHGAVLQLKLGLGHEFEWYPVHLG
jgi:hypothetical protein